jgi:hypothetical protein
VRARVATGAYINVGAVGAYVNSGGGEDSAEQIAAGAARQLPGAGPCRLSALPDQQLAFRHGFSRIRSPVTMRLRHGAAEAWVCR